MNLAIICACLTTLKPLIVHFFPTLLGTTSTSRSGTTARNGTAAAPSTIGTRRAKREVSTPDDDESLKSELGLVACEMDMDMGGEREVTRPERSYGN